MAWQCSRCTFSNEDYTSKCQMCGTDKQDDVVTDLVTAQSATEWTCSKCTFINNYDCCLCQICSSEHQSDSVFDLVALQVVLGQMNFIDVGTSEHTMHKTDFLSEMASSPLGLNPTNSGEEQSSEAVSSAPTSRLEDEVSTGFQESESNLHAPESELRIVLIGRTGVGKSTTGNTILGVKVFQSDSSPVSVTKGCQRGTASRFGRELQVIDTPGMFDTEMSIAEITREVVKCVGMTAPGPHVFVLVITPDRQTEEVQKTTEHFVNIFGEGMQTYLIVLFTKRDDLINDGTTIEKYLEKDSGKLKAFLLSCNNRYVTFNNRGTPEEQEEDVKNLLYVIDEMVKKNRGVYTNAMFQQAERIMREKEEKMRREHEAELEIQMSHITEMYNQQLRTQEENYKDITAQLQRRLQDLEKQQTAGRSCEDPADVIRHWEYVKAEHRKELKRIREMSEAERERLRKQNVNFRERARKEVNDGSDFVKDTLVPGIFDIAKIVLPFIFKLVLK